MDSLINFFLENIVALTFFILFFVVFHNIQTRKKNELFAKKLIEKAQKTGTNEPLTLHPIVDQNICGGCGACTKVCPEGDILKLVNHRAQLISPTKCVGHGECEKACPLDAIKLVFGTKTRGMDIPRVSSNYETNVPGLYIAGELGGMGLIRNAIKQGIMAATDALKKTSPLKTDYELLIVGAGPAGLASSLVAISQKKSYLCIEQNSFGGTVYNFPRQKIVMSHPFELPITGKMKFKSNKVSKEELLSYWSEVKQLTGLKVQENTKFEELIRKENYFEVKTNRGVYSAKKIILAMGVRGSPRKLNVPGENSSKVTYNLLDPDQYMNKNIAVVGGGNAGLEAAQMLAQSKLKNKVILLVRGETFDRSNEDNIKRILDLEKQGLVTVVFSGSIQEIFADKIRIKVKEDVREISNDFVFVFAGAEMPHKFLMSLGVEIDKKFEQGHAA